jgi:cell division protein ZapE
MILGRFLAHVMDRGVEFVMTSNYAPDELYPNGLQRERFLPAIVLLRSRLDVLQVDNGTDYRRLKMERLQVYHTPLGEQSEAALERIFAELADVEEEGQPLEIEGRAIPYRRRAGGLVWFDFAALCETPRSAADYVELARRFHTVLLSGIPRLSARNADAARRFTWMVDVFYDVRVKLVVSAEAPPEEIFVDAGEARIAGLEFSRTVSRLHEMQSAQYLQSERARNEESAWKSSRPTESAK